MGLKTKLAMAVATSAAGAAMIAGGSFAMFTAQATNTGNTFTAGTVAVQADHNGTIFSTDAHFSNLAPGDSSQNAGTMKITDNTATLNEWVGLLTSESGALFQGSNPLSLSYSIQVYNSSDVAVGSPQSHTVDASDASTHQTPVELSPGEYAVVTYSYSFPSGADNTYMGATGNADVTIDAVQARNNTNSGSTGPNGWG